MKDFMEYKTLRYMRGDVYIGEGSKRVRVARVQVEFSPTILDDKTISKALDFTTDLLAQEIAKDLNEPQH